ncbi:putative -like family protein [Phaeoacremonium minimum UCRPA7]|uniref:Putative-like family protein n=1 Tax=Phaeoacremonium minimum (strain UCR-PA7) TaxID=1286976 RepID=R8BP11_PHAM7|nr:putative -like family protein [Phaeoacremonium minimum UCRPA7]EOO01025.1 putative -like family protein [Phaeoacremonium minimum UCRPA7]
MATTDVGVPALQVDYTNVDSIREVLEKNAIDTVISCVNYEGDALSVAQLNLIKAATDSSTTKRFIPSTFGIAYPKSAIKELPMLADYFKAIDELKKSGLQWTVINNGCFLDYWGQPHIKTFLRPSPFGLDIANKEAAIPGDGNTPFSLTYTFDVARYVVALQDLDEWPEVSRFAGDIITWNEFLRLAEETTGSNFKVTYDSIEKLKKGEMTELPSQVPCYAFIPKPQFQWFISIFARWTADEEISHIPAEMNSRFPDISPLTVRQMLNVWRKE